MSKISVNVPSVGFSLHVEDGRVEANMLQRCTSCERDAEYEEDLPLIVSQNHQWVDWSNNRRLLEPIGDVPPAEFELMYHRKR